MSLLGTAQAARLVVAPILLYSNINTPPETTLGQSWADAQAYYDYCSGACYTVSNLKSTIPGYTNHTVNGVWFGQWFDRTTCFGTSCTTSPNWSGINVQAVCPGGWSQNAYWQDSTTEIIYCQFNLPTNVAPPKNCQTCVGNSIYAGTGEKLQTDTDYSALPALAYSRSYRSDGGLYGGFFASPVTVSFLDLSQATGTQSNNCYPSYYLNPQTGAKVSYCFPYSSNGTQTYQVATSDGRNIQFTGPNNAVTENADINERVKQITNAGVTQWQVTREDDSVEIYSTAGSLLQKTLRGGQVVTYTYSTASTPANIAPHPGMLLTESDPFGHTLSWQYNSAGQVVQMTDPAGGVYQYGYDGSANLTSVGYPDGTSKTYVYNESAYTGGANLPNILTGIIDEAGVRFATFSYNSSGIAIGTQYAGGVANYAISGFTASYQATITDPLGTSRTYNTHSILSYTQDTGITQPAASGTGTVTESWSHDANGNISQQTDFNGNITNYVFDLTRNLETSRTEAYGKPQARSITTTWDANWRQPDLVTEPSRKTAFTYDSLGNVLTKAVTDTTVTPNVSRTWTYTYDTYGRMLTAKGPRTDVNSTTTYAYYTCTTGSQCGQLQTVTDPVGNVTTYNTYNAHGQPLTITDPNGVVTTLTYDTRARLTSRKVGTETTGFTYYQTGLLKQVTLPDSSYVLYTYDTAHRLTQISDGAGNSIVYTLDNMGNRTAEKTYDPGSVLHRTHMRVYNTLNKLYQDVNAAGTSAVTTTYAYDNNGNQTGISAPLSRNTTNVYDALNRLTQITDPGTGSTYFGYDAEDNLTSVKDPRSLTTSYAPNGFGNVGVQTSPDTGTTTNTYDSGGNLATATDARGALATYVYDKANRVTSIVYSKAGVSDQTIAFGYDTGTNGKGRLTSASDANHSLSFSYDGLGRVTGKGLTIGTVTKSVGYGYTNADLTALTTASGQAVTYGYNSNHQVTSIAVNGTTVLQGVTYEPFSGVNGWTWGNGTTVSRTFNGDGLISQIVTAGTTLGYSFDNANRITGISDSSNSALTWTYGYDTLDRLTSGTTSAITDGWTYDANGNRLTQTGTTPITYSVSSSSNQLNATTGGLVRSYAYDAAGNPQGYGTLSFGFNDRGRMMAASGGTTSYLYNALGQMIEKSGTLGTTIFVQDEGGHLIGEYDGSGNLVEETVWLRNIPVATLRPNGSGGVNIFYVHTDHLNTPRKVSRPSDNQLVWRWDADPFGSASDNQNPVGLGTFVYDLRFPGQYYMAETGLSQNYHREFDPLTGRYVQSDPVGLAGGNYATYAYVRSSPVGFIDPLGLAATVVVNGNNVSITIPIQYSGPGATPALIQAWNDAIQRMWSGPFGRFTVKTTVTNGPDNKIAVPCGNGRAETPPPWNTGTWPARSLPGVDPLWTASHEAGHLMGLIDEYNPFSGIPFTGWEHDIMGATNGVPSERDIAEIIHWSTL
jgi:RHS repeat-associated protein